MSLPVIRGAFRILDFDLEQRPLSYWVPDRPTGEITAIAWAWTDKPSKIECRLLTKDTSPDEWRAAFAAFVSAYDEADMVTGHYIRRFDLPQLQSNLTELGMAPLTGPKLVQDTKTDLIRWGDLPKTQEHLAEMLGVHAPKVQMSQSKWREANRLTEAGLLLTERRVVGDVKQHMAMRKALLKAGLLGPPRVWKG